MSQMIDKLKEMEPAERSSLLLKELPTSVQQLDAFRKGLGNKAKLPMEISFDELIQEKYGMSRDTYMKAIGVDTRKDTMENMYAMPDSAYRWLVPVVIHEAITLGMRMAPFYPNIISGDQPVSGLTSIMPYVNMSDAAPARVNEGETIPLGTVSFGQKQVKLFKIGKGFKLTDEVRNYVSMDVMAIFLRDFGVQLGYAMDTLAMDVAINGNQPDGSEAAPVIGVETPANGISYLDLLRIWIRGSRIGKNYHTLIGSEDAALHILNLPEFKNRMYGQTLATLNMKTPVPTTADFFIHPGVPANSTMLIDPRTALVKLTAQQLLLESERIVSNQTSAVYASLTTGFSKMYMESTLLVDGTLPFADNGFPEYMNPDPYLTVNLE